MEKNINQIFNLIKKISPTQYGSLDLRCLKLNEEVGELTAEVLKLNGFKKTDLTKDQIRSKILLESCDSLIMIMDILIHQGFTDDEICDMCESQLNKWISQLEIKIKI